MLIAAAAAARAGRPLDPLRTGALALKARTNHNKATWALANKLARIGYSCLRDAVPYGPPRSLERKISRSAYPIPA